MEVKKVGELRKAHKQPQKGRLYDKKWNPMQKFTLFSSHFIKYFFVKAFKKITLNITFFFLSYLPRKL